MAYVQLSLLGIPAVVVHGNALSLEVWGVWYTPAHVMVGWGRKLKRRREAEVESIVAGYQDQPTSCNEPGALAPDVDEPGLGVPEVASTGDGLRHSVGEEEGDVAVLIEADREEVRPDPETSIAALFEQLTGQATAAKAEITIFDRIGQMTLF